MAGEIILKWDKHASIINEFKDLLSTGTMVDVTLACDGESLKAHKIVLSACSPFFKTLLSENPCKHPIIIFQDIKYAELKSVIDFMYDGEVIVSQDHLTALIKTAQVLKIKVLGDVMVDGDESESRSSKDYHSVLLSAVQSGPIDDEFKAESDTEISIILSEDELAPQSCAVSGTQSELQSGIASRFETEDELKSSCSSSPVSVTLSKGRRRGMSEKNSRCDQSDSESSLSELENELPAKAVSCGKTQPPTPNLIDSRLTSMKLPRTKTNRKSLKQVFGSFIADDIESPPIPNLEKMVDVEKLPRQPLQSFSKPNMQLLDNLNHSREEQHQSRPDHSSKEQQHCIPDPLNKEQKQSREFHLDKNKSQNIQDCIGNKPQKIHIELSGKEHNQNSSNYSSKNQIQIATGHVNKKKLHSTQNHYNKSDHLSEEQKSPVHLGKNLECNVGQSSKEHHLNKYKKQHQSSQDNSKKKKYLSSSDNSNKESHKHSSSHSDKDQLQFQNGLKPFHKQSNNLNHLSKEQHCGKIDLTSKGKQQHSLDQSRKESYQSSLGQLVKKKRAGNSDYASGEKQSIQNLSKEEQQKSPGHLEKGQQQNSPDGSTLASHHLIATSTMPIVLCEKLKEEANSDIDVEYSSKGHYQSGPDKSSKERNEYDIISSDKEKMKNSPDPVQCGTKIDQENSSDTEPEIQKEKKQTCTDVAKKRYVRLEEFLESTVDSDDNNDTDFPLYKIEIAPSGLKIFHCLRCAFKTRYNNSFKRHVLTRHKNPKKIKCEKCTYVTTLKQHLKRHIKEVHEGVKPFHCTLCPYKTFQNAYLKRHVDTVHEHKKPFTCGTCDQRFTEKRNLRKHIIAVHKQKREFMCSLCSYRSAQALMLKRHVKLMHGNVVTTTSSDTKHEKSFACGLCGFRAKLKASVRKHVATVHEKNNDLPDL